MAVDQMEGALTPDHPWIAPDLDAIAREAGLPSDANAEERFDDFLCQAASIKSPEDVLTLPYFQFLCLLMFGNVI